MILTHLDLCSGIGGFTIAASWAGFETIGFSEIEPYCCALLAQHWPHIKNYGDLRNADFNELRGRITVLSAGVPCQPASLAGKRRGKADDRWLWEAVLDVVERVGPAWALFENPPGILTLDEFASVLLRLESLGYAIRLFSVPANALGAKHRRQRVFTIAYSDRTGRGEQCGTESAQEERLKSERYLWRLTQPPLCLRTDGILARSHQLKALGNAVVPQQAYPFFNAIAQTLTK